LASSLKCPAHFGISDRDALDITVLATVRGDAVATASVRSDTPDPDESNNTKSLKSTVRFREADLSVRIVEIATGADNVSRVGDPLAYRITVTNGGPDEALGVRVALKSGDGIDYVDASPGDVSCSPASLRNHKMVDCSMPDIKAGGSFTFEVTAKAVRAGTWPVEARVRSLVIDPGPHANDAAIRTRIFPPERADLTVRLETNNSQPVVGQKGFRFRAILFNKGPDDAEGVVFEDTLPAGFSDVRATARGGECDVVARKVRCTFDEIGANAVKDVVIGATPSAPGAWTNEASAFAETGDPRPRNNTASKSVDIVGT
jgi:uncharacterized repeat protein (TIGR01451 family)